MFILHICTVSHKILLCIRIFVEIQYFVIAKKVLKDVNLTKLFFVIQMVVLNIGLRSMLLCTAFAYRMAAVPAPGTALQVITCCNTYGLVVS